MGNFVFFYTAALEELACHEYIVVSISRPYSDLPGWAHEKGLQLSGPEAIFD
jgi:hypothetical protein